MNNEREVDPDEDPELALETVEELQVALAMAVTERDAARRDLAALQAQLAVANDLLNDWEASATIESPPALAYRTSKYLHPEAYLASQPPSSLGALETCPTCGDHVPLEASGAEHRRRCSPRGTGLDPATVEACVAAIARRGAGGTRAYAADYIECIRGLVGDSDQGANPVDDPSKRKESDAPQPPSETCGTCGGDGFLCCQYHPCFDCKGGGRVSSVCDKPDFDEDGICRSCHDGGIHVTGRTLTGTP